MSQSDTTTNPNKTNTSIEHLRIYQLARSLEDQVYDLAKSIPAEQFYPLGNDLRRSSAAVAHYIAETHRRYSYVIKLECLHAARIAAEETIRLLENHQTASREQITEIINDYTLLIKQSWGLIKYLKAKQELTKSKDQAKASDELVAARS